jgi:hypothetical protein
MTNEQLSIILDNISDNLVNIANEVGDTIKDGDREPVRVWVGDGPEPSSVFSLANEGYEFQEIGEFTAKIIIRKYAYRLAVQARSLRGDGSRKAT